MPWFGAIRTCLLLQLLMTPSIKSISTMTNLLNPILAVLAFSFVTNCKALEFEPISMPTLGYTSQTTRIDLGPIPDSTPNMTTVFDATLSINFNPSLSKTTVGIGWTSWGAPPYTETVTPDILFFPNSVLTMALSVPQRTFGFELQGDAVITNEFHVQFFDGFQFVGSITQFINGDGGARLFAATSTTRTFDTIVIVNVDGHSGGFAIANLRYSVQPVPEPATWATGAISAAFLVCVIRKGRGRKISTI